MRGTPSLDAYERIRAELGAKSRNAARRNKVTMWAYYGRMLDLVEREFGELAVNVRKSKPSMRYIVDGGLAGAALAITQDAADRCPTLGRDEAAELWALSVYANRILSAWGGGGRAARRSLAWLRKRAGLTPGRRA